MKILINTKITRTVYTMTVMRKKLSIKITIFILLCVCAFVPFGFNLFYITNTTHPGYSQLDQIDVGIKIHYTNVEIFYKSRLLQCYTTHPGYSQLDQIDVGIKIHYTNVEIFYKSRLNWPTSNLGGILFKREEIPYPNPNQNRTFIVLVWKYWDWLKNRHVHHFGKASDKEDSFLEDCSVTNCIFSGDDNVMATADAVLIHLQRGLVPEVKNRNPKQRWIFLNDESPKNAFSLANGKKDFKSFYNVFNWSMTYRSDSDVPVPYGRTLPLEEPLLATLFLPEVAALVPNWGKKIKETPATVLMSNCGVKARNEFLKKLRKHVKVDVYGKCSDIEENKDSCPGHFRSDCETVAKYKFYLVLENTRCFQYLTEKIFYHAYSKGAVPVIWGPSIEDVETLLPPNSYIYVDENTNIEKLAKTILTLAQNDGLLLSLHMWRNNFEVVNEHGYFGSKSYHLCRLCEALNYNDEKEKIYGKENLDWFLDPTKTCKA